VAIRLAALVVTGLAVGLALHAKPHPLARQPFPDAQEYADGARQIADGKGYVTVVHGGESVPPRYPPGFSLALAPFAAVGDYPDNVQLGAKLVAVLYVLAAVAAAWTLGGPLAALLTAGVVAISPFARDSAALVLSDALAATFSVLLLCLLRPANRTGASLAGMLAGLLITIRLNAFTSLLAVLAATRAHLRLRVVLLALPAILGLVALQWATFGNPLTTGYSYWGLQQHSFAGSYVLQAPPRGDGPWVFGDLLHGRLLHWTCPCVTGGPQASLPNLAFYPFLLLGAFWIFAPPLWTIPGIWYAWRNRREPVGRYALVLLGSTVLLFVFFFFQAARFMAAPATVLLVLSSVTIAMWLERARGRLRNRAQHLSPKPGSRSVTRRA
jgi:4-amino-4-deoxy-L-arabinose transferase-like glycosyltransferase